MIRKATKDDVSRIAEIYIFNNRLSYYPVFKNEEFSFKKLTVVSYMNEILENNEIDRFYVYEDNNIIKGFIEIIDKEIFKLYVEPFFQNNHIGQELIEFAIKEHNVNFVWCLEKNDKAIKFYERNGFKFKGETKFVEGTKELEVKLLKE